MLKAEFSLKRKDLYATVRVATAQITSTYPSRIAWSIANILVWTAIATTVFTFAKFYKSEPHLQQRLFLIGALVAIAFSAIILHSTAWRWFCLRYAIDPNGAFLSHQSLEADDVGITISNAHSRSEYRWSGFMKTAEDGNNLYIFIDAMHPITIPKKVECFPDLRRLIDRNIKIASRHNTSI